jgi:hypothetical protein
MRNLWPSLVAGLTKDDLFLRVILFVFSLFALWLGVEAVRWLAGPDDEHWGWSVAIGLIGAGFLFWGAVVFVAAFTSPSSRWSRFADKCYPDPAGLDDLAIFLVVVLFPAAALTLVLRVLGVRGYDT